MRTIVGYTPDAPARRILCRVTVTLPDASTVVLSEDLGGGPPLTGVQLTDTLEHASTATVELSRAALASLLDPLGDPTNSPLLAGNPLEIEFADVNPADPLAALVWTRGFDGEIVRGSNPADEVSSRLQLQCVSRDPQWWSERVTSPVYSSQSVEDILEAAFTLLGGLSAGDFDLPTTGRTILRCQAQEITLAEFAQQLLSPLDLALWWDPVARKLTTVPLRATSPVATIPKTSLSSVNLEWQAPEAVRVRVEGGAIPSWKRLEIGPWLVPTDPLDEPPGVRVAAGSKTDFVLERWWAQPDGSSPHYHDGKKAGDYLWVIMRGDQNGVGGLGFRGPVGVTFLQPGLSTIYISDDSSMKSAVTAWVTEESFNVTENRYIFSILLAINVRDPCMVWDPVLDPRDSPGTIWHRIKTEQPFSLNWECRGRQEETDQLEQLTAQAVDEALLARFGESSRDVSNPSLLVVGSLYGAVQDEADRQLAVVLEEQYPGSLARKSMDLRYEPGDPATAPHPRQAGSVVVRAQNIQHAWKPAGSSTTLDGVAL